MIAEMQNICVVHIFSYFVIRLKLDNPFNENMNTIVPSFCVCVILNIVMTVYILLCCKFIQGLTLKGNKTYHHFRQEHDNNAAILKNPQTYNVYIMQLVLCP